MKTKQELKAMVCAAIDARRDEILALSGLTDRFLTFVSDSRLYVAYLGILSGEVLFEHIEFIHEMNVRSGFL